MFNNRVLKVQGIRNFSTYCISLENAECETFSQMHMTIRCYWHSINKTILNELGPGNIAGKCAGVFLRCPYWKSV
jgi:hypothetical protein